jgi:hypothetical protein
MASTQLPATLDINALLDATTILLHKQCRVLLAKTVDATLGGIIQSFPEGGGLQQFSKVMAESLVQLLWSVGSVIAGIHVDMLKSATG